MVLVVVVVVGVGGGWGWGSVASSEAWEQHVVTLLTDARRTPVPRFDAGLMGGDYGHMP